MSSQKGTRPLVILVFVLLVLIVVPFMIWGAKFDAALSLDGARGWMEQFGSWAWLAGMVLLVADILLPIPSTVVMSALGLMYGWLWGGVICTAGSVLSGVVAYGSCRLLGRPAARWIAGEEGLSRGEEVFATGGGWLVALSRWTPVLPEAVACLAGLMRMRWSTFLLALMCGSLPLGFTFAAIGHAGQDRPALALLLSGVVPVLLWLVAGRLMKKRGR
ncbi:MAG: VTT domain-containing protein [Verrucomicrobiaceae bacterium]|nr:VTT domain-containing protein [Verrucomicrobiaceae bacterium]